PLIMTRPQIAQEVLLAVCIEEPTGRDRSDFLSRINGYGMSYWPDGHPPMYFRGPFLEFLQNAPDQALDTIIRLTNFATQRWLENRVGPNSDAAALRAHSSEFMVSGQLVRWFGDAQVFNWHRFLPMSGEAVESALMALEKWLYDALDAYKSVESAVKTIYAESISLSFAGVLLAVGLRRPLLFRDLLQPL